MKIVEPSVELIDSIKPAEILAKIERCGRVSHQSAPRPLHTYGAVNRSEDFIRKIIKRGHESVLEHVSLTFHIICDRAIMAELTRHRHASFTVESTRYVKHDELTVVLYTKDILTQAFIENGVIRAERSYGDLCRGDATPEEARTVLPLCLKSELYMTANLRELRHILKLRTSKAAHPQMRFIAGQILNILRDKLPVIVEDIKEVES